MSGITDPSVFKIDAIGGLCAAGVLAAVVLLAAAPAITEKRERAARESHLIELRAETDHAVSVLRETRTRLRRSEQESEQLPDHLKAEHDLNQRIAQIVDDTEAHGLAVQTILPGEPERGDRYTRTPIELSTRAPIDAIARYLHDLHASSPDLELTSLEIREPDESGMLNTLIRAEWITLTN